MVTFNETQYLHKGTTADGDGSDVVSNGETKTLHVWGDFGTGTATLSTITPGIEAEPVPALYDDGSAITFTAEGSATVWTAKDVNYRLVLAGATAPDFYARIDG